MHLSGQSFVISLSYLLFCILERLENVVIQLVKQGE